jgi:GxxExxY protein
VKINDLSGAVVGAAIEVHRRLGPGLLESAYEACLAFEIAAGGFHVERQKAVPLFYREVKLDCGYRIDLLVNDTVIVELKAVERLDGVHTAALLTYLKLTRKPLGLLINFHVTLLKDGIRRIIL